jgi:hypothetical protein
MTLPRRVDSETLDHLDENDPRAKRSRRDLQRVHKVMRTCSIMQNAVRRATVLAGLNPGQQQPLRIIELGAGDATLTLAMARTLSAQWPHVQLTLLDRQVVVSEETLRGLRELGWQVEIEVMDVMEWIAGQNDATWDMVLANLFVHHFDGESLNSLLQAIAARSRAFVACEPRRSRFTLAGSHLIGCLGANDVTREDAVLSVHAGFNDYELCGLWPALPGAWQLLEYEAGLFNHCFVAARPGQSA